MSIALPDLSPAPVSWHGPARPNGRPHYIAVEGVIGAGKTTLARGLADRLGGRLLAEEFEENPFLSHFYEEPERYAFPAQSFFLLSRYRQQSALHQLDLFHDTVVSDYTFDKDRIFATITLNEHEFMVYEGLRTALAELVVEPDLIVYLQSDVDQLMSNIATRGRAMESAIDSDYLTTLKERYARHFLSNGSRPTLLVAAGDMTGDQLLDALVAEIDAASAENGVDELSRDDRNAVALDEGAP